MAIPLSLSTSPVLGHATYTDNLSVEQVHVSKRGTDLFHSCIRPVLCVSWLSKCGTNLLHVKKRGTEQVHAYKRVDLFHTWVRPSSVSLSLPVPTKRALSKCCAPPLLLTSLSYPYPCITPSPLHKRLTNGLPLY